MCVIYIAYNIHPDHPLVLIANRDEFYDRPTVAAAYWNDHPEIFAGRDLVGGGTWLGITHSGRVAAVTNYREPSAAKGSVSRGDLVAGFLISREGSEDYLRDVEERQLDYSGFNLIVGEFSPARSELFYFSNRGDVIRKLEPGIYGLSNHLLDTSWPKVRDGKTRFGELMSSKPLDHVRLFDLLADESVAEDTELPDTGIGYELEKALSAIFIKTPIYGTRSSTVVTFDNAFEGRLKERVFV
ncbi:MAG: NRDE family protein [Acidobacteriota bacterium]